MAIVSSIEIPVPLFLEKYLTKRYGNNHVVSANSFIGMLVIDISTKYYVKPVKKVPKKDGVYSLLVTEFYHKKKVFRITPKKLKLLAKLLVKLFYEDLVTSVYRDVSLGKYTTAKGALKEFLSFYDINEEELKLDSAYMEYQRKAPQKINELKKTESKKSA